MKKIFIFLVFLSISLYDAFCDGTIVDSLNTNTEANVAESRQNILDSLDMVDIEMFSTDLDKILSDWIVQRSLAKGPIALTDSIGFEYPDSVYSNRLRNINSVISLPYNSIIRNHIHVYTIQQRQKFSVILGLSEYYFPMIEDVFDSYGLPTELKYMAIIESALNPNAVSRVGATGMWQFINSTGKSYGLVINSVVDERRDPVKATHAAAKYLRDLYKIYGDWVLVIAAYNCGPGNVNKAIRRSGNKKDYWDIYYRLPRETRGYIPQFVAAAYASTYYADHKIVPTPITTPMATDTIMLHQDMHFNQISEVLGIPYDDIKALNPAYKTGLIPAASRELPLTLPVMYLGQFIDMTDSIHNYKSDEYVTKVTNVDPSKSSSAVTSVAGKTKITYTVKDGDNLGYIADWYNIKLSDLRYWNDIYSNTIRVGQKLSIFVDPNKTEYYSAIDKMTFAEKQATKGKTPTLNTTTTTASTSTASSQVEGDYIVHVVRKGDTIWDIVKLYGVTTSDVLSLNNISNATKIQVGQKLKIKKKS